MSISFSIRNLVLSTMFGVLILPGVVSANTASWTSGILPDLAYYYWAWGNGPYGFFPPAQNPAIHNSDDVPLDTSSDHCVVQGDIGCGWAKGLEDAVVTVNYGARLVNDATNIEIPDGTGVEVGTRVRVEPIAYGNTDISWVGTGASSDSPYGRWVANAGPVALSCNADDLISGEVYILLNMDDPTNGLVSSTNADCVGNVCTLNNAGPATFNFEFDDTYGKFYYRFKSGSDCYAFNAPMREGTVPINNFWGSPGNYCEGSNCMPGPDYQVDVPAQSIPFSLTVNPPPVTPPGTPTLTGPTTGYVGDTLQYTCTVPSSDTGTARCGFDIGPISDNIADTHVPLGVPPFPAINTPQVLDFPAITAGTYTISAIAEDDNYAQSATWSTPITVTISERPCPIQPFGLCNLPETASGGSYNQLCGGAVGNCNYTCSDGNWTEVENSCTPPTITNLEICTLDLSSCANTGGTLVTDVNEPLSIKWTSVNADVCSVTEKPAHSDFTTGDDPDDTDNTGIFANPLPSVMDTYQISCNYGGGTPVTARTYVSTSALLPVLSTSMTVVRSGSTVRLNWNTNNGDESLCTLAGAGVETSDLTNPTPSDPLCTGGAQTGCVDVVVNGRTTYTLDCGATGIALKTVEIIPISWE